MKIPLVIVSLAAIFTWNAFGKTAHGIKSASPLANDKKIFISSTTNLKNPMAIELVNKDHVLSCQFSEPLVNSPSESHLSSQWAVIANGANFEKRTIALFNSESNKVVLLNCSKSSPAQSLPQNSGEGSFDKSAVKASNSSALSDIQVIEVLRSANIEVL